MFFNLTKNGTLFALKGTISGNSLNLHQTVATTGAQHASVTLTKSN